MTEPTPKRLHIIGRKNSGKTTLIVELVTELTRQGYRVGTIKHTHHNHELDTPGKDSHRHREAGSAAVGILTNGMNAIFWPKPGIQSENGQPNSQKYQQFDSMMGDCDIVLVEGDSKTSSTKIEVYRAENGTEAIAASDETIHAVVTDDHLEIDAIIWKRNDLTAIVRNIEELMQLTKA
ncbi:MAG: molybdopterin-guanine dinucleotide biosynthesis protein B [Pirellulaceae bacterium]